MLHSEAHLQVPVLGGASQRQRPCQVDPAEALPVGGGVFQGEATALTAIVRHRDIALCHRDVGPNDGSKTFRLTLLLARSGSWIQSMPLLLTINHFRGL